MSTAAPSRAAVTIRRATPEDAPAAGKICFEAFHKISTAHGFPPDVPEPARGVGLMTQLFSHPGFYCVVAEADGRIAGSNCLDAVVERARERKSAGVGLVRAAFHNRSFSLYGSWGFDVREPLSVFQGPA